MIYLVEDDENIRELVVYTLDKSGLEAEGFGRPSEFWKACREEKPELILLDIMLPEEDGLSILKKLRGNPEYADVPIMMLTAMDSEYDKVNGLDSGADDYLPKPFGMMEMVARVRALLRRSGQKSTQQESLEMNGVRLVPEEHMVYAGGRPVELTLKEYDLLHLLMENPGIAFTRDELLSKIWGYTFSGESRTVDVHVRTLRQKLGVHGDLIETVRGVGYRAKK